MWLDVTSCMSMWSPISKFRICAAASVPFPWPEAAALARRGSAPAHSLSSLSELGFQITGDTHIDRLGDGVFVERHVAARHVLIDHAHDGGAGIVVVAGGLLARGIVDLAHHRRGRLRLLPLRCRLRPRRLRRRAMYLVDFF